MRSTVSPIVANLYIKNFKVKALSTVANPLDCGGSMWITPLWSKSHSTRTSSLSTSTELMGASTSVLKIQDLMALFPSSTHWSCLNQMETTVYRKPFHTDQYLKWDSHHTTSAKYSVSTHLTTDPRLFAQTNSFCKKKNNAYKKCY